MSWLLWIKGLVEVVTKIFDYLNIRTLKKAGSDETNVRNLEEHNKRVKEANKIKSDSDSLSDDWLQPNGKKPEHKGSE